MEQVRQILDASWVWRMLMALCRWTGTQWRNSGVVQWFLHPPGWWARASEGSVFSRLWRLVQAGLCRLYRGLRLDRLLEGSLFLRCGLWCTLSAALAPLLPTMAALGLVLVSFASLVLALSAQGERTLRYAPMNKYLFLFAGVYLAAVFLSVTPEGSLLHGVLFLCFALFALVVENALTGRREAVVFTGGLVVSGSAVSMVGIAQYLLGASGASSWVDSDMFSEITVRVYSTLQNPNMLAEYLVLLLPLGAALLLSARSMWARLWWLGCSGLIALCLLVTFSRGAYLAALIAMGLFAVMMRPQLLLLLPVGLAGLYLVLPDTIIARFASIGDLGDSSTSYRVAIWMGSLAMLRDHWIIGVGPGTAAFNRVYPAYGYSAANAQHTHNLLLQLVSDGGILALVLFLLIIFTFVRQVCAAFSRCQDWRTRLFPAAAVSGVMGFLAQGMTEYSFYNYRVALVFWSVLGLGAVWARLAGEEGEGR